MHRQIIYQKTTMSTAIALPELTSSPAITTTTIELPDRTSTPTGGLLQQHDTFAGHNKNAAISTWGDPRGLLNLATLFLFLSALWLYRDGPPDKYEKKQKQRDAKALEKTTSATDDSASYITDTTGYSAE